MAWSAWYTTTSIGRRAIHRKMGNNRVCSCAGDASDDMYRWQWYTAMNITLRIAQTEMGACGEAYNMLVSGCPIRGRCVLGVEGV